MKRRRDCNCLCHKGEIATHVVRTRAAYELRATRKLRISRQ
jgi:hypothetical protein